jgi:predicted enzyme related to lactoylglutathione lyase
MGNAVTWFEVGAADDRLLAAFYGKLFGWELRPIADGYTMVNTLGRAGINGGIGRSRTGEPWAAFYVEADDPGAVLERAESLGAATVVPVTELPGFTFAMFDDPDGLLIGLMKPVAAATSGMGPPTDAGAVDWFEVLGSDAARTQAFYRELFGWQVPGDAAPGYGLVDTGADHGISGGLGASQEGMRWATVYANVDDVEACLAHAEGIGGERVYGPIEVDDHMRTGALRDPAGNVFGVYHHPPH